MTLLDRKASSPRATTADISPLVDRAVREALAAALENGMITRSVARQRSERKDRRHRVLLLTWVVVACAMLAATGATVTRLLHHDPPPPPPTATADFSHIVQSISPSWMGVGASTYGATPLSSNTQAANERRLGTTIVRVPVSVRNGVVTSGASGAGTLDVGALINTYLQWGDKVLVVIDGGSDDFDVRPGDATAIIKTFGYNNGVEYSSSNEPGNQGRTIDQTITQARMILAEGRALYPDFTIWGPAWASYDRATLVRFATALGSGLAGIDFHSYAMGETSISTEAAMRQTSVLQDDVARTVADLKSAGLSTRVAVDELNLTWRYDDGTAGGNSRVLSAVNTAFIASACGHVMLAGGLCMPYATQNGPLGMLTEKDQIPLGRPASTPMPAFWGVAAWTGAGQFPHLGYALYATTSSDSSIEVYAASNLAGGYNLVLVNTATSGAPHPVRVALSHVDVGSYVAWSTDPAHPYAAPTASAASSYSGSVALSMAPMSVTTIVLSPQGTHGPNDS